MELKFKKTVARPVLTSRDSITLANFDHERVFEVLLPTALWANLQHAVNITKSKAQGQGDENFDAVRQRGSRGRAGKTIANNNRGLDNAGKTTIVKRIMGEDVNTVSPTLGFIIKTIDYEGYAYIR